MAAEELLSNALDGALLFPEVAHGNNYFARWLPGPGELPCPDAVDVESGFCAHRRLENEDLTNHRDNFRIR